MRSASVAQLVERQPSKLNVAGSIPVRRFHTQKGHTHEHTLRFKI